MRYPQWVNVVAASWLFASAWFLPGPGMVRANETAVGLLVFLTAFVGMTVERSRRINTALGLWAMVSPFVFAFAATPAALNQFVVGLVIFTASLWPSHRDLGGGHPTSR
ncbi:MAG TPA: SPW repeat protein [Anaeromyxobacteraceae bacterium]|nr:SPW repeat protein [Anaeromyxobacteraceae bacterium]